MSENSNAVVPANNLPARSEPKPSVVMGPMVLGTLDDLLRLAQVLASSGMFDSARTAAAAAVKIMTGRELGFGPMASLIDIHFFDGKPTIGAHLRAAAIKRSGRYDYRVVTATRTECSLEFLEKQDGKWEPLGRVSMTIAEAVESGVA